MGLEGRTVPPWYVGASRGQWLALLAALLGWLFDGFEMGIFPLVARPALLSLLGLSAATPGVDATVGPWNGWLTATFLVGAALGGWLFGWLGDRVGRVRAMALSVLTYSLFTGTCGLARDPLQLAGLRFLAALGMGGEWALGVALVMESWPARARPALAGLIGAAANVGFAVAVLLVMALQTAGLGVEEEGWRWVLGFCALPAVLTFFVRLFVPESEKWRAATRASPAAGLLAIFAPGQRGRTLLGAALAGIALIGTWASVQWIPLWVERLTHDPAAKNLAQLCSAGGAVLGTLLGAALGHRLGRRRTYFGLCLGSLLICAYLYRWHAGPASGVGTGFCLAVGLTGALTASFYGWLPLYLPELFPTRVRATGQGFAYNSGRILAAAGALSTGLLMSEHVFAGNYARAGAAISLVYVAGMVVIWLAPETQGQPLPE